MVKNTPYDPLMHGKILDNFDRFCVTKRGKAKFKIHYGINDYFKFYKKIVTFESFTSKYALAETGLVVDIEMYKKVLKDFCELLSNKIITDPMPISIPFLGTLSVRKRKMHFRKLAEGRHLRIDYKTSKELNKLVYFTNDHRDNYFYKIHWQRPKKHSREFIFYQLRFLRKTKRTLAKKLLTDTKIDFFEMGGKG